MDTEKERPVSKQPIALWILTDITIDEFNQARERLEARQEKVTAETVARELQVPADRIKVYEYEEET